MTQRELAEKDRKTETTISRWVNGSRTPFATDYPYFQKLCNAHATICWIVEYSNKNRNTRSK